MTTLATIASRPLRITGWPHSGWRPADADDPSSRVLMFRFTITDDGAEGFVLDFASLDGVFFNDSWYASLEKALTGATEVFGIARSEWRRTKNP